MKANAKPGHRHTRIAAQLLFLILSATTGVVTAAPGGDKGAPDRSANQPPVLSNAPPSVATLGQLYEFLPVAYDPDGDPVSFSTKSRPSWSNLDRDSGRLYGTPSSGDLGVTYSIIISVSDRWSKVDYGPFSVTVVAASDGTAPLTNTPPVISGTPPTSVTLGTTYSFTPSASDADGDGLLFSIRNKPAWATFSAASGLLSGTPGTGTAGVYSGIEISVSDGKVATSLPAFSIEVLAAPNTAPVISGTPPTSVTVGTAYSFTPSASDADGDTLGFTIRNKPAWANFSTTTGRLSGTPGTGTAGVYGGIEISVSDGKASTSLPAFSIEVLAPSNTAPVISGTPPGSVAVGQSYSFKPTASDADGDTLTFSIQNKPAWATFSSSSGQLSGTPQAADVGSYANIIISVSDGKDSAQLAAFSITVEQVASGSATLSWTAPTQTVDGTSLTDLAGYRIAYGTSAGNLTEVINLMNPGLTTAVIEQLVPGTWYFAVKAVSASGGESDFSNVASKNIQ